MLLFRRILRTAALLIVSGSFSLLLIADSSAAVRLEGRISAQFKSLFLKAVPAKGTAVPARGKFPGSSIRLKTGQRMVSYRDILGRERVRAVVGSGGIETFMIMEGRVGGSCTVAAYHRGRSSITRIASRFIRNRLIKREYSLLASGRPSFLYRVELYSEDGIYTITQDGVVFHVLPGGTSLQRAVLAASHRTRTRPEYLIPFRMGSDVVFLQLTGSGGSRYLHIHPNESTAFRALHLFLKKHGGQGLFFLGRAEIPVARRDRYFPFTVGWRKFYFDPNRIFSDRALFREFLRARIFYRYAGYNRYWFYKRNERKFRKGLSLLREVIIAFFMTRPEPAVIIHDNSARMQWSESVLKGQHSAACSSARRIPGERFSDFILVTDPRDYRRLFASRFNLLLQSPKNPPTDGSASVVFGALGKRYFCIEAGRDAVGRDNGFRKIVQMLEAVRAIRFSGLR